MTETGQQKPGWALARTEAEAVKRTWDVIFRQRFLWRLVSVMPGVRRLGDEADTDAHVNPNPSYH